MSFARTLLVLMLVGVALARPDHSEHHHSHESHEGHNSEESHEHRTHHEGGAHADHTGHTHHAHGNHQHDHDGHHEHHEEHHEHNFITVTECPHHPGQCKDEQGTFHPNNTVWAQEAHCAQYRCLFPRIVTEDCPHHTVAEGCELVTEGTATHYPDCCPHVRCN